MGPGGLVTVGPGVSVTGGSVGASQLSHPFFLQAAILASRAFCFLSQSAGFLQFFTAFAAFLTAASH